MVLGKKSFLEDIYMVWDYMFCPVVGQMQVVNLPVEAQGQQWVSFFGPCPPFCFLSLKLAPGMNLSPLPKCWITAAAHYHA